jgi:hypothetical protein
MGGTNVYVGYPVGLTFGNMRTGVADGTTAKVVKSCVAMAFNVSAAAV